MANITIKSNSSVVRPQLGQSVRAQTTTAPFESRAHMAGAIYKGLDIYNQVQEQKDALRGVNAINDANRQMGELQVKLTQEMQGSNAADFQQEYDRQASKIMQDCYNNAGIKYKKTQTMYNRAVGGALTSGSVWALKYQTQQMQNAKISAAGELSDYLQKGFMLNGESLPENWKQMQDNLKYLFPNLPPEKYHEMEREFADSWTGNIVQDCVTRGEYGKAMAALGGMTPYISNEVRSKLSNSLGKVQRQNMKYQMAKTLMGMNLRGDAARSWVLQNLGKQKGEYTLNSGVTLENLQGKTITGLNAVTGQLNNWGVNGIVVTSGKGDFGGHVPGSAHDVGLGIDIWSQDLENATPEQRNAFANALMANNEGLYVLNEWENPSGGSTGGHFHLEFTNYKEPSMTATDQDVDEVIHMEDAMFNDQRRRENEMKRQYYMQMDDQIFQMFQQGTSYDDTMEWIRQQAGTSIEAFKNMVSTANYIYGARGKGSTGSTPGARNGKYGDMNQDAMWELDQRIMDGGVPDEELKEQLEGYGVSMDVLKQYREKNDRALRGMGEYGLDWTMLMKSLYDRVGGLTNEQQMGIKEYGLQVVKEYAAEHGGTPSDDYILDKMEEGLVKGIGGIKVVDTKGYGASFWNSIGHPNYVEYNQADLQLHKIRRVFARPDGKFDVYTYPGSEYKSGTYDADEFRKMMEGSING